LLLPAALQWLTTAQACFDDPYGSLDRGLLTSIFALVVGMERMFHLDEMEDRGFAVLTGGSRCPSRHEVGAWRRHVPWYEVDAFCRRTSPWELIRDQEAVVSFDEHSIPRWTRKYRIRKGYVTVRNKYMRCEKLYYGYDVVNDRFLTVRGTQGDIELRDVSVPLLRQTLTQGQPDHLHALFDAGAGKADADVRTLWELAEQTPNLDITMRACRYPHRVQMWKSLPAETFVSYEEPGVCVGAAPKEIRLAETETILKGEDESDAIRTVVCRELVRGPKKDRWHPLYTTYATTAMQPIETMRTFRTRQHHEQGYRVEVHDEFLNATPCGYDKKSPDRQRPRFNRGPLQMIGWLAALVYNSIGDLAKQLPAQYLGAQVKTVRRTFLDRKGQLYFTPNALIVYLDSFRKQEALIPLIDQINSQKHRVPWLDNRQLVISLTPDSRAGP